MFRRNVISVLWACLTVIAGCKGKRNELMDINKMPVAIKFTIPERLVANSQTQSEQESEIRLKVQQHYPEVSNLRLSVYQKMPKVDYYEYLGERKERKVSIFVFDKSGDIAIDGFESLKHLGQESRYESTDKGLNIYKRFVPVKQQGQGATVSIFYQWSSKQISFHHDDGFSIW